MSTTIFPVLQSSNWKMTRSPQWSTQVKTASSGNRKRNPLQAHTLWKWTLKNGVLQAEPSIADLQAIQDLFIAMFGRYDFFLWTDPEGDSIEDPSVQINVSGTYYWPVAFTHDTVDFDRFAYQLWTCGTLEFEQLYFPTELSRARQVQAIGKTSTVTLSSTGNVVSISVKFLSTTSGNTIVVACGMNAGNISWEKLPISVSDTQGNVYAQVFSVNHVTDTGPGLGVFYATDIIGPTSVNPIGSNTITFSYENDYAPFGIFTSNYNQWVIAAEYVGPETYVSGDVQQNDAQTVSVLSVTDGVGTPVHVTNTSTGSYSVWGLLDLTIGGQNVVILVGLGFLSGATDTQVISPSGYATFNQPLRIVNADPNGGYMSYYDSAVD